MDKHTFSITVNYLCIGCTHICSIFNNPSVHFVIYFWTGNSFGITRSWRNGSPSCRRSFSATRHQYSTWGLCRQLQSVVLISDNSNSMIIWLDRYPSPPSLHPAPFQAISALISLAWSQFLTHARSRVNKWVWRKNVRRLMNNLMVWISLSIALSLSRPPSYPDWYQTGSYLEALISVGLRGTQLGAEAHFSAIRGGKSSEFALEQRRCRWWFLASRHGDGVWSLFG